MESVEPGSANPVTPDIAMSTVMADFSPEAARLNFKDIIRAVRTRQWAKNALIFAGFVFAGQLRQPDTVLLYGAIRVLLAFICFCALSGAAYLLNDWCDVERDRVHPIKRNRPLASGRMTPRVALFLMMLLMLVAVIAASVVYILEPAAWGFPVTAILYFALTITYSLVLKHEVIIDVLCIAAGFVLRVVAGCVALPVAISPWIIFCTFTLALFIALCKRRAELLEMGQQSATTRKVLPHYTVPMLDTFIAVTAGLTITAYSLYTFNAPRSTALSSRLHDTPLLMITIPCVVYGIFRYLLLAHSSSVGGEPEQMLRDKPLMWNVAVWGLLVAVLTLLK
ncbi:MAG: decaprenyl-phosphate phosphoribosyltransferase [Abitibacteriaceae bacterium]|nr:decaprenyl-phosphate phosphoribosyltransferase [Abditibacteriaceae bacterium]